MCLCVIIIIGNQDSNIFPVIMPFVESSRFSFKYQKHNMSVITTFPNNVWWMLQIRQNKLLQVFRKNIFSTLFFPFLEAAMFLINKSKVKYIWQSIIDRSIVRYWFKDRFMASSLVTREILFPIFDFTGRGRLFYRSI